MTACCPVDAYYEVAEMLGDGYFTRPTPDVGVLLTVIGRDGLESRWHLDRLTASRVADRIHGMPGLAVLSAITYDMRAPRL